MTFAMAYVYKSLINPCKLFAFSSNEASIHQCLIERKVRIRIILATFYIFIVHIIYIHIRRKIQSSKYLHSKTMKLNLGQFEIQSMNHANYDFWVRTRFAMQ